MIQQKAQCQFVKMRDVCSIAVLIPFVSIILAKPLIVLRVTETKKGLGLTLFCEQLDNRFQED